MAKYWDVQKEVHGKVIIAGEHSSPYTGFMEGAVESGMRAARQAKGHWFDQYGVGS